mgnify:CR=1 FL=1
MQWFLVLLQNLKCGSGDNTIANQYSTLKYSNEKAVGYDINRV